METNLCRMAVCAVNPTEEVYTVQEVAQNLKVSERTVRNWIESRDLPAFPIGKRVPYLKS